MIRANSAAYFLVCACILFHASFTSIHNMRRLVLDRNMPKYILRDMNTKTTILIKADKKVKAAAQKAAKEIGIPLGTVLGMYLRKFAREALRVRSASDVRKIGKKSSRKWSATCNAVKIYPQPFLLRMPESRTFTR